jgi:hypothetical protein
MAVHNTTYQPPMPLTGTEYLALAHPTDRSVLQKYFTPQDISRMTQFSADSAGLLWMVEDIAMKINREIPRRLVYMDITVAQAIDLERCNTATIVNPMGSADFDAINALRKVRFMRTTDMLTWLANLGAYVAALELRSALLWILTYGYMVFAERDLHQHCNVIAEQEGVIFAQKSVIDQLEGKVASLTACVDDGEMRVRSFERGLTSLEDKMDTIQRSVKEQGRVMENVSRQNAAAATAAVADAQPTQTTQTKRKCTTTISTTTCTTRPLSPLSIAPPAKKRAVHIVRPMMRPTTSSHK